MVDGAEAVPCGIRGPDREKVVVVVLGDRLGASLVHGADREEEGTGIEHGPARRRPPSSVVEDVAAVALKDGVIEQVTEHLVEEPGRECEALGPVRERPRARLSGRERTRTGRPRSTGGARGR